MYIFDLDQTLADIKHRIHHILKEKPDWDSFYKEVLNDTPIEDNCKLIRDLEIMDVVVILTGSKKLLVLFILHIPENGYVCKLIIKINLPHLEMTW